MKNNKKLLLVLYCTFANIFPLFAENEENYTDSNYSIESEDYDESESSWLDEYPTYAKLNLGFGQGSKFNYVEEFGNQDAVVKNPYDYTKGTSFVKLGFEIGKVVGSWNFGFEASFVSGKVKKFTNYGEDLSCSIKMAQLMGNAYYNIPLDDYEKFVLSLGAGLGFDIINLDPKCHNAEVCVNIHDHTCFVPAGQLYIGIGYNLTEDLTAALGYKFHKPFKSIKWTSADATAGKYNSSWKSPKIHLIEASIMYTF